MVNKPIQTKKLYNPTNEDLEFMYDSAPYELKAGKQKDFIDYVAIQGAKILADKNVMTTNPDEHKTLMNAYLTNVSIEDSAKTLKVDLDKVRKTAMVEKNKEARQINLEAQVMEMKKELDELKKDKEEKKPSSPSRGRAKKITRKK